jgi:hypothetical protein
VVVLVPHPRGRARQEPSMDPVRCAECGFLAVRDPGARLLVEVKEEERSTWEFPKHPAALRAGGTGAAVDLSLPVFDTKPRCAVGAMPIDQEAGGRGDPASALPVINKDRPCGGFIKWRRDFSPKEHQQMWMAEQFQKFQAEQSDKARRQGIYNVLLAGAIGLVGVLIGRVLSQPPAQPVIIQMPAAPEPKR